jgi:hypothetical protein
MESAYDRPVTVRLRRALLFAVAGALATASAALGFGTFRAPKTYAVQGFHPFPVAIGDFNSDGKRDLAVASEDNDTVSVLLGRGDGTFKKHKDFKAGNDPYGIAVGNFNGDRKQDIAIADNDAARVSVLRGRGDGTFRPAQKYDVGDSPFFLAAGDLNRDGRPDLITPNNSSSNVSVVLAKHDGTFAAAHDYTITDPGPTASYPVSVEIGNFNGRGAPDLAVLDDQNYVTLLYGRGDGTFKHPASGGQVPSGASLTDGFVAGRFNRDRLTDLAVSDCMITATWVLLGKGGDFRSPDAYAGGYCAYEPAAADVNRDGKLDLLMPHDLTTTVDVLRGKGDGTFRAPQPVTTGAGYIYSVAAGRLNADRGVDLAVPDFATNRVAVLLNKP